MNRFIRRAGNRSIAPMLDLRPSTLPKPRYTSKPMFLFALLALQDGPSLQKIQSLIDSRDVKSLSANLLPIPAGELNPFGVIRTGGAYDVGRFGWKALPMKGLDQSEYIVITTAMTSEEVGDILLRREGGKLRYIPETDGMGIDIAKHSFDLRFDLAQKRASLVDDLSFSSIAGRKYPFVFRMSPCYQVTSIESAGKPVKFVQAGGVVMAPRPSAKATYRIKYGGIIDLPNYAGSVSQRFATLTNDYWYPMIARQPAPYDIAVHVPSTWTVVGQGEQTGETATGDSKTVSFRMDMPCVYYSISCGPMRSAKKKINGKEYRAWSPRMAEIIFFFRANSSLPTSNSNKQCFADPPSSASARLIAPATAGAPFTPTRTPL